MQTLYGIIFVFAIFLVGIFLSDAIVGFIQTLRGRDEDAVRRRLSTADRLNDAGEKVEIIRRQTEDAWYSHLPFQDAMQKLGQRAEAGTTLSSVWLRVAVYSFFLFVVLAFLLPIRFLPAALIIAPLFGFLLAVLNLRMKANKRCAKFAEQLPDALDLMVRSLRIGHPVSGAMSMIARELPAPIGPEFAIACEEVTYGHDIPSAFRNMAKRVPVQDLGFLNVVLQVQQDSGGNLVETLSGLSKVIRERYRMFRKVKSLTVEGRVSAWILSFFPFGLFLLLKLTKPDYFDQMIELDVFPFILAAILILLLVNMLAMRMITNIKV